MIGRFSVQVEDEMIQCVVCEDWLHGRVSPREELDTGDTDTGRAGPPGTGRAGPPGTGGAGSAC